MVTERYKRRDWHHNCRYEKETENQSITNNDAVVFQLTKLLTEIESEGRAVESLIDPLNKEIEKLGLEEQELWRNIKNKYSNLSDEEIVEYVRKRLLQENLS